VTGRNSERASIGLVAALLSLVGLAAACGGGAHRPLDQGSPQPARTGAEQTKAVATPAAGTPERTPTPIPLVPPAFRTGIAEVDAVIEEVLALDATELAERSVIRSIRCEDFSPQISHPPCATGQQVMVFSLVACEGQYVAESSLPELYRTALGSSPRLVAVFGSPEGAVPRTVPTARYVIWFARGVVDELPPVFFLDAVGRILSLTRSCNGFDPDAVIDRPRIR